jgi:hypothetical protein
MATKRKTKQPTTKAKAASKKTAQPTAAKSVDKTAAAPAVDKALSKAVAASWTDKKVHAARTTRTGCKVGNKEYPSVRAAFVDLGWPIGIHQRIRLLVKREGAAEVDGKKIVLVAG